MALIAIKLYLLAKRMGLTIDNHAFESLAQKVIKKLVVLTLAPHHDWCRNNDRRAVDRNSHNLLGVLLWRALLNALQHHLNHFFFRKLGDSYVVMNTVRLTGTCVEDAQIVVNFGHGCDR